MISAVFYGIALCMLAHDGHWIIATVVGSYYAAEPFLSRWIWR